MKTNQDGGGESSTAAAGELKNNQKIEGGARKGAAKKKPDANGDGIPDYAQDGIGASRMGYNQSFGAGKANCYAKGAAKVAEIMTFGASKYINHGAADAGHGGPAGHTHPSMTTKSVETTGGGSNSSKSVTQGGSSSSVKTEAKPKVSRETAYNNRGKEFASMNRKQYGQEIDKYNASKKPNMTSSSSSSNNTNSGSTTRSSKTITSKESMAAVKEQGKIAVENRQQKNAYNKELANIKAVKDSTNTANKFINKLPGHMQSNPKAIKLAKKRGGLAANDSRVRSGEFSGREAYNIFKAGQNKNKF